MIRTRKIARVQRSRATIEGAGVHLRRAFGQAHVPLFDPFLMLDDFRSDRPEQYLRGFPWHPHRGIETITYMLDGTVEHGDSMGNRGIISPGGVQWMTAGSGVIHQEMPRGDEHGLMGGFQLWANLPRKDKMMNPRYRDVKMAQIPLVELDSGTRLRVIAGKVAGVEGPVRDIVTDPAYTDVTLPAGVSYEHPTPRDHTVCAYVIRGTGTFSHEKNPFAYDREGLGYFDMRQDGTLSDGDLVLFGSGDQVTVSSGDTEQLRFLLFSGKPIGEPVAWYGPIVMNTREELQIAFDEYRMGTFVRQARKKP